jgi:hypothetical protein
MKFNKYSKPAIIILLISLISTLIVACGYDETTLPEYHSEGTNKSTNAGENTLPNDDLSSTMIEEDEDIEVVEETTNNLFSTEIPNDELFIMFFFTENHHIPSYFIPNEEFITEFLSYINEDLPTEEYQLDGSLSTEAYPLGYYIVHNDVEWEAWSSGNIVTLNPNEFIFVSIDMPDVVNHLRNIMNDIGIAAFNPSIFRNGIVSVKTEPLSAGIHDFSEYTLADETKLTELATILLVAENTFPTACPFNKVFLTITLINGEHIKLAMASDDCNVFFINGQMFTFKINENEYWYEYFFSEE